MLNRTVVPAMLLVGCVGPEYPGRWLVEARSSTSTLVTGVLIAGGAEGTITYTAEEVVVQAAKTPNLFEVSTRVWVGTVDCDSESPNFDEIAGEWGALSSEVDAITVGPAESDSEDLLTLPVLIAADGYNKAALWTCSLVDDGGRLRCNSRCAGEPFTLVMRRTYDSTPGVPSCRELLSRYPAEQDFLQVGPRALVQVDEDASSPCDGR